MVDGQQGHRRWPGVVCHRGGPEGIGWTGRRWSGTRRSNAAVDPIPVYTRFVFPNAGTARTLCQTQIPVQCGGVTVHPGDVVFGDQDGVIVASEEELRELLHMRKRSRAKRSGC